MPLLSPPRTCVASLTPAAQWHLRAADWVLGPDPGTQGGVAAASRFGLCSVTVLVEAFWDWVLLD